MLDISDSEEILKSWALDYLPPSGTQGEPCNWCSILSPLLYLGGSRQAIPGLGILYLFVAPLKKQYGCIMSRAELFSKESCGALEIFKARLDDYLADMV